jgi:hypothetical protein
MGAMPAPEPGPQVTRFGHALTLSAFAGPVINWIIRFYQRRPYLALFRVANYLFRSYVRNCDGIALQPLRNLDGGSAATGAAESGGMTISDHRITAKSHK